MDRDAVIKKIKLFKTKAKAARKAGKRDNALGFKYAMERLERELKAAAPKIRKKKSDSAAPVPGPAGETKPATPAAG